MSKRRTEKPGEEAGSQEPVEPEVTTRTLMELLVQQQKAQQEQQKAYQEQLKAQQEQQMQQQKAQQEQLKAQQEQQTQQQKAQQEQQMEQQRMLRALIEQQKEELAQHRREVVELKAQRGAQEEGEKKANLRLPKPTLQKLGAEDDIEHFLATFERIAKQQGWPAEIWPTQLAGLLTGKAMAAYAGLTGDSATVYGDVKKAILHRYDVHEEAHRRRFRLDRKKPEESYKNWSDRLLDHFTKWTKDQKMPWQELMVLDQFLAGAPEELRVWVKERKPESLRQAVELADDYALARSGGRPTNHRPPTGAAPPSMQGGRRPEGSKVPYPPRAPLMDERSRTNLRGERQCFQCKRFGHLMQNCPLNRNRPPTASGNPRALLAQSCDDVAWNTHSHKYLRPGTLDGRPVQMLIDTGCDKTMVSATLVDHTTVDQQDKVPVLCTHGDTMLYPTARVQLRMTDWESDSRVVVAPNLPVDVLLGRDLYDLPGPEPVNQSFVVMTRSQAKQLEQEAPPSTAEDPLTGAPADPGLQAPDLGEEDQLRGKESETPTEAGIGQPTPTTEDSQELRGKEGETEIEEEGEPLEETARAESHEVLNATPVELKQWQQQDPTLLKAKERAGEDPGGDGTRVYFYYRSGLIYRSWRPRGAAPDDARRHEQLVLPVQCRSLVLRMAHDVPMAGHLGVTKTKDRVLQRYYWPGVFKDIADYCRTCEVCQRSQPRHAKRAEMIPMPLMSRPFQRIAMDLVGPLPRTQRGNRFVLTICDYATRYPEAIALSSTEAPRIAKELIAVFARMGVPDEILTDQGPNFMSALLEEVYRLLQITRIRTTPYHPQTDGLVERFNGTLKAMLKKFVSRNQKDWDEYLPYLLFAYREVPQESTGFSPFELLFGRHVRGPLDILRESWTGDVENEETPVAAYVVQMRDRLQEMAELVKENAGKAQQRQKRAYDRGSAQRTLQVGHQALVLLPNQRNRLKLEWVGPYKVIRQVTPVDYEVETPGRRKERKVYHINLLKRWYSPPEVSLAGLAMFAEGDDEEEGMEVPVAGEREDDDLYPSSTGEPAVPIQDIAPDLATDQQQQMQQTMDQFPAVFQAKPGRTTLTEHEIHVGDSAPIRQKPYRIPYSRREVVKRELGEMMEAGVIRPSTSPWASPIVLVEKKDGGIRFCVDYRKLNQVAKFDAYPMPRIEEMFEHIGSATVISTLDLARGYWQIPMSAASREKTAFATPFGLFEFDVMPFGLHNAPATFQRTMNHILRDCQEFSGAYIDDIVIFSRSWEEHLRHLQEVFHRLQQAGLTVKLKKCQFGKKRVHYLGHVIGGGEIQPDPGKVAAVKDYPVPVTKKDVRAFLGLVGYYRRFIPQFASLAAPLTDLTRKGKSQKVEWSAIHGTAFRGLKGLLVVMPTLRVTDPTQPYILQTDASDRGLGAVLSQGTEQEEHPVAFASRKLLPREVNYSTIEKECLAIVWALKFFNTYLYGQNFTIETDHQPLAWLHRMRSSNSRLTRWALAIQPYYFKMKHRRGKENGNADGLSRGPVDIQSSGMTAEAF